MKKAGLILGIFALFMFAFSSSISAQGKGKGKGMNKEKKMEKRLDEMKERLSLTDTQTDQIEVINKKYVTLVADARAKEYDNEKGKKKAVREIRKAQNDEIVAILDETQQAEWKKMKEEKKEKTKQKRKDRKNKEN
jgi:hypothetical protein